MRSGIGTACSFKKQPLAQTWLYCCGFCAQQVFVKQMEPFDVRKWLRTQGREPGPVNITQPQQLACWTKQSSSEGGGFAFGDRSGEHAPPAWCPHHTTTAATVTRANGRRRPAGRAGCRKASNVYILSQLAGPLPSKAPIPTLLLLHRPAGIHSPALASRPERWVSRGILAQGPNGRQPSGHHHTGSSSCRGGRAPWCDASRCNRQCRRHRTRRRRRQHQQHKPSQQQRCATQWSCGQWQRSALAARKHRHLPQQPQ